MWREALQGLASGKRNSSIPQELQERFEVSAEKQSDNPRESENDILFEIKDYVLAVLPSAKGKGMFQSPLRKAGDRHEKGNKKSLYARLFGEAESPSMSQRKLLLWRRKTPKLELGLRKRQGKGKRQHVKFTHHRRKRTNNHGWDLEQYEQESTPSLFAAGNGMSEIGADFGRKQCFLREHTNFNNLPALNHGPSLKVDTWSQCCAACHMLPYGVVNDRTRKCNVWVYCGDKAKCGFQYRHCWLKYAAHPAAEFREVGRHVPWSAGVLGLEKQEARPVSEIRKYHTVTTMMGYWTEWQMRIHHYWWQKTKMVCEKSADCEMGGWTRILHDGVPDKLMDELNTFVAEPHPDAGMYMALHRSFAITQWLQSTDIPEKYILMLEQDHINIRPMPNIMKGERMAVHPFWYITPTNPDFKYAMQTGAPEITAKELEKLPATGSSPAMISKADLIRIAPHWANTSLQLYRDDAANRKLGQVTEMYGFLLGLRNANLTEADVRRDMMCEPPFDNGPPYHDTHCAILHYTFPLVYDHVGRAIEWDSLEYGFNFNKRKHLKPPKKMEIGVPPESVDNIYVHQIMSAIREAVDTIPHWDDYAGGENPFPWDGKTFGNSSLYRSPYEKTLLEQGKLKTVF